VSIELFDRTGWRILSQLHPLDGPSTLLVIHPETYFGSGIYVVNVTIGDQPTPYPMPRGAAIISSAVILEKRARKGATCV